ncbi:hypothetical protein BKA64DRAFT_573398, partial [Cadophora sp. MPI-SDFR-AT-0126]
ILNSRLFKFVVGETEDGSASEFSVHEDAIAQLSTPLRILVKSSPEAQVGSVRWKDVSKATFERFVQFAYTGNYSIPETEKRSAVKEENGSILNYPMPVKKHKKKKPSKAAIERSERESKEAALKAEKEAVLEPDPLPETKPELETKPEETQETETQLPETSPKAIPPNGEDKPSDQYKLTANFKSLSYPVLASLDNYEGTCEPSSVFEKDHSYSNVFLSHASLYRLGDVQLVDSLKALALFKLHKTLCTFELDNENIGDITDLARYAYTGEGKEGDEVIGGLRNLVCQYMAIHAVELSTDAKFMNLLAGGGQIVKDFFQFQLQRIH